ncbi:MAG: glycosyltransferase [Nitrospinae bacterium]|nr:glycosyltransferase [Nitrospinota bacterium]
MPKVTVQIPVFNERFMVNRIIHAVAKFEYPQELLQIQVLDDSTDDTPKIAREAVEKFRAKGVNIVLIHRAHRTGYKAGALAEGLKKATGEFIAIFDADFVPHSNFLQRIFVEHKAFDDPQIGFVQTRWTYLNRNQNLLTRSLGIIMNVHFFIDQPARYHANLPFHFNGSGGIWRARCIEDAGGWHFDTLTEDLDLSYRARLKGWRGIYLLEEEAPNDLPADILAFKQQQKRWARGIAQCFRKLLLTILVSKFSPLQKLSSIFHISGYFLCPCLVIFIVLWPIIVLKEGLISQVPLWLHFLGPLGIAYVLAMYLASIKQKEDRKRFFLDILFTALIGVGISLNNAVAVGMGLFRKQTGVFERTPKGLSDQKGTESEFPIISLNRRSVYKLQPDWTMWGELLMACYSFTMWIWLFRKGEWLLGFPMALYGICFACISLMQLRDVLRSRNEVFESSQSTREFRSAEMKTLAGSDVTPPAE